MPSFFHMLAWYDAYLHAQITLLVHITSNYNT